MSDELICPSCGQPVDPPDDMMQNLIVCPHCGDQYFRELVLTDDSEEDDEAIRAAAQAQLDKARDLDGLRIRALSVERRAMYRTRSYFILGVAGSLILLGELIQRLHAGGFNRIGQLSMVLLAIGCVLGTVFFARKIATLQHELQQQKQTDPTESPDFEPLEDGSQTWRQLEEMNRPRDEDE